MFENFDEMQHIVNKAQEQLNETRAITENNIDYSDIMKDYYNEQDDDIDEIESTSIPSNANVGTEDGYYGELEYDEDGLPIIYKDTDETNDITLDEYDTPIFSGGPTVSQVKLWKKKYAGYSICVTEILDETFVFRTLNRFEYKQIISIENIDAMQREEIICKTATLFPDNYSWGDMAKLKAGIPSTYSNIIMERSGFTKDYAIRVV